MIEFLCGILTGTLIMGTIALLLIYWLIRQAQNTL